MSSKSQRSDSYLTVDTNFQAYVLKSPTDQSLFLGHLFGIFCLHTRGCEKCSISQIFETEPFNMLKSCCAFILLLRFHVFLNVCHYVMPGCSGLLYAEHLNDLISTILCNVVEQRRLHGVTW